MIPKNALTGGIKCRGRNYRVGDLVFCENSLREHNDFGVFRQGKTAVEHGGNLLSCAVVVTSPHNFLGGSESNTLSNIGYLVLLMVSVSSVL